MIGRQGPVKFCWKQTGKQPSSPHTDLTLTQEAAGCDGSKQSLALDTAELTSLPSPTITVTLGGYSSSVNLSFLLCKMGMMMIIIRFLGRLKEPRHENSCTMPVLTYACLLLLYLPARHIERDGYTLYRSVCLYIMYVDTNR